MKFATVLLLLVGSFVLNCSADTQSIPLKVLEKLRISNEELEIVPEVVEEGEFNYEVDAMGEDAPYEVPDQEEIIERPDEILEVNHVQSRAGKTFHYEA